MELGEMISYYRKEQGLTIDQLVDKSGVPKGTLNKIIAGITKAPTLENVRSIAHALNKTLDDFDVEIKEAPVSAEPKTEASASLAERGALFYKQLVAAGYLREGEDFTDAQLQIVSAVLSILDATFPKNNFPDSSNARKIG